MNKFKHHTEFITAKAKRNYLAPHVCFNCRKTFKKPPSVTAVKCPDCGTDLTELNRKFSAPKRTALQEWQVVEYVVRAGFRYQSINLENGRTARYPKRMKDAVEFVSEFKDRVQ